MPGHDGETPCRGAFGAPIVEVSTRCNPDRRRHARVSCPQRSQPALSTSRGELFFEARKSSVFMSIPHVDGRVHAQSDLSESDPAVQFDMPRKDAWSMRRMERREALGASPSLPRNAWASPDAARRCATLAAGTRPSASPNPFRSDRHATRHLRCRVEPARSGSSSGGDHLASGACSGWPSSPRDCAGPPDRILPPRTPLLRIVGPVSRSSRRRVARLGSVLPTHPNPHRTLVTCHRPN
jgi:hypothetical protein